MARKAQRAGYRADTRRVRTVITPEGVPLAFTLGARGARALAFGLDLMMIGAIFIGVSLVLLFMARAAGIGAGMGVGMNNPAVQALVVVWIIAMFVSRHVWFLLFELGPRGATPGKRVLGLRVAARDGGRLTSEAVVARNILREIEITLPMMFLGDALRQDADAGLMGWAGAGWFLLFVCFPFFNRDALRTGDLVAGTWVVEASRHKLEAALSTGEAARQGHSTLTQTTYRFGEAELAVYGELELQALERVLREDRAEALAQVADAICTKIGWTSGRGDERAFLEAYYTQLRARLEGGMRLGQRKADKYS